MMKPIKFLLWVVGCALKILLGGLVIPFYLLAVIVGCLYALGDGIWKRSHPIKDLQDKLESNIEAILSEIELSNVKDIHRED